MAAGRPSVLLQLFSLQTVRGLSRQAASLASAQRSQLTEPPGQGLLRSFTALHHLGRQSLLYPSPAFTAPAA